MIYLDLTSALTLMFAYLDPGSGSILVQLLISAVIGVGIYLRARWGKVKGWFSRSSGQAEDTELEDDDFDV